MDTPHYFGPFADIAATILCFGAFAVTLSAMAAAVAWGATRNRRYRYAAALALVGGVCSAGALMAKAFAIDLQLHEPETVSRAYVEAIGLLWKPVLCIGLLTAVWCCLVFLKTGKNPRHRWVVSTSKMNDDDPEPTGPNVLRWPLSALPARGELAAPPRPTGTDGV
ncbi:MAG: hypothetical protein R3236_11330 [Phycisphaeraceae bacterium]|nr:hypothetical protein [Phycisphaeraceae bacterium]